MVEEPTQPPAAYSEAVGERLHDIPITIPMQGCETLNQEEDVQELNNVAAYHENNPATYGIEVSSNYGITQLSSTQFPIEVGVEGKKKLEGINITDISHTVRSGSSPTSEESNTWFLSILQGINLCSWIFWTIICQNVHDDMAIFLDHRSTGTS